MDKDEFKFPDELEEENAAGGVVAEIDIEIEDDTPEADRGRKPADPEKVKALEVEVDELDKYSAGAKEKMVQMKKVWHDERREKEAAMREQQEAISVAQRLLEENKRIRHILTTGEQEYVANFKNAAQMELDVAKRAYKDAYDAGDTDKIVDAQQALQIASIKVMQANNFRMPPLQSENFDVQIPQQTAQAVRVDPKAEEWQERNQWFGSNKAMTAFALGLHDELKDNGVPVGSDEYYSALDKTLRRRFPEAFGIEEPATRDQERPKPSTVVAPATRSTSPQKVRLRQSQLQLIKKLGITPEQYVKEFMKEARNG